MYSVEVSDLKSKKSTMPTTCSKSKTDVKLMLLIICIKINVYRLKLLRAVLYSAVTFSVYRPWATPADAVADPESLNTEGTAVVAYQNGVVKKSRNTGCH